MNFAQLLALDPSSFRRRPQVPGLRYSTFYLPSVGGYDLLYSNLADYDLGDLLMPPTGTSYKPVYSTSNGGESGMTYMYWNDVSKTINEASNFSSVAYLPARPIRHFDFSDNTTYPLRTLMPSGGYVFYIADNGDGTYRHYEAAPSDTNPSQWIEPVNNYLPILGLTIADSLNNTLYIVNSADHVNSTAQVCLNYTV